jgi:2-C-methyl-D-erythritol 4-phosphate cytidylyltransferase/2-C-methyl-D-erythritol 2,4-cyclodiphosphate synthase
MNSSVWTIVVGGGSGRRFGGAKQFELLDGRRVIDRSVETAFRHSDGVVAVVPQDRCADVAATAVVAGGSTRSSSVRAGLAAVPGDAEIIIVHDAARPAASDELFERGIAAIRAGAAAAIPGVPVTDTIRHRDGTPVDRAELVAVQTPQCFAAAALRAAHASEPEATDDATLVQAVGGDVTIIEGDPANMKITDPGDIARLSADAGARVPTMRIGQGFDIHRFSTDPNRRLILGGVHFEGEPGLEGHSDADAIAHACADALLGAVGLGDIGQMFPDTDPTWSGANSIDLLREVVTRVRNTGFVATNIDCSVIAERPKLSAQRDAMQAILSEAVGAPVTVKGRRAEGIGGLGRKEGVAVLANALVVGVGSQERSVQ